MKLCYYRVDYSVWLIKRWGRKEWVGASAGVEFTPKGEGLDIRRMEEKEARERRKRLLKEHKGAKDVKVTITKVEFLNEREVEEETSK